MKHSMFKYLAICLTGAFLFTACSSDDEKNDVNTSKGEITATLKFSNGKTVDYAYTPKSDDIVRPTVNGPNGNDHYKFWFRGESKIDGMIYTINLYVTMPKNAVADYPFGVAWQWHDKGFVTEIHVGVQDADNPLDLKTYVSTPPDVDNTNSKGVTINSFADNHIKGTFSGKAAFTSTDIVTITNGKFDVDIERGTWED